MYSVVLSTFKIANARHRVVGKRIPMQIKHKRAPVGTGNGLVIVSKNFTGTCRGAANVTKCALIFRDHKFRLIRRRPFASTRRTVGGKASVIDSARVMRLDSRHVVIDSASGKTRLGDRVRRLGRLLCTCQRNLVGRDAGGGGFHC